MSIETFTAATVDDLLHDLYSALLERGVVVRATRGEPEDDTAAIEHDAEEAGLERPLSLHERRLG